MVNFKGCEFSCGPWQSLFNWLLVPAPTSPVGEASGKYFFWNSVTAASVPLPYVPFTSLASRFFQPEAGPPWAEKFSSSLAKQACNCITSAPLEPILR
jgi:hypothetical protein